MKRGKTNTQRFCPRCGAEFPEPVEVLRAKACAECAAKSQKERQTELETLSKRTRAALSARYPAVDRVLFKKDTLRRVLNRWQSKSVVPEKKVPPTTDVSRLCVTACTATVENSSPTENDLVVLTRRQYIRWTRLKTDEDRRNFFPNHIVERIRRERQQEEPVPATEVIRVYPIVRKRLFEEVE